MKVADACTIWVMMMTCSVRDFYFASVGQRAACVCHTLSVGQVTWAQWERQTITSAWTLSPQFETPSGSVSFFLPARAHSQKKLIKKRNEDYITFWNNELEKSLGFSFSTTSPVWFVPLPNDHTKPLMDVIQEHSDALAGTPETPLQVRWGVCVYVCMCMGKKVWKCLYTVMSGIYTVTLMHKKQKPCVYKH